MDDAYFSGHASAPDAAARRPGCPAHRTVRTPCPILQSIRIAYNGLFVTAHTKVAVADDMPALCEPERNCRRRCGVASPLVEVVANPTVYVGPYRLVCGLHGTAAALVGEGAEQNQSTGALRNAISDFADVSVYEIPAHQERIGVERRFSIPQPVQLLTGSRMHALRNRGVAACHL